MKIRRSSSVRLTPALVRSWLPPRRSDAHKGDFGHVLVLGGSRGMMGAPRLSVLGALRAGAGLVTLGGPAGISGRGPWEALTLSLPDRAGVLCPPAVRPVLEYIRRRKVTSVVLGPGLSTAPSAARFVRTLLGALPVPTVLDADALNILALDGWPARLLAPLAATPHRGEMARLTGESLPSSEEGRLKTARELAARRRVVCVLKGHRTVVTDGLRSFVNSTGNPGMASGGMGDVLAGALGALAGQARGRDGFDRLFHAAAAAVHLHGLAGDLAVRRIGPAGFTAGEVADLLPSALGKILGRKP